MGVQIVTSSGASATNAWTSPVTVGAVMAVATAPTGDTAASQPKIASSRSAALPRFSTPPIYDHGMRAIAQSIASPRCQSLLPQPLCVSTTKRPNLPPASRCQATSCPVPPRACPLHDRLYHMCASRPVTLPSHSPLPIQSSAAPVNAHRVARCITKGTRHACLSFAPAPTAPSAAQWPAASPCSSSPSPCSSR